MKLTFGSLVEAVKQAKMFTDNWYFAEKGTIIDYNTLLQMAEYNDAHHIPGEYYFIDGIGSIGQLIGTQEVIVFKGQPRTIYNGNINDFRPNQTNQPMSNRYGVDGQGMQMNIYHPLSLQRFYTFSLHLGFHSIDIVHHTHNNHYCKFQDNKTYSSTSLSFSIFIISKF